MNCTLSLIISLKIITNHYYFVVTHCIFDSYILLCILIIRCNKFDRVCSILRNTYYTVPFQENNIIPI